MSHFPVIVMDSPPGRFRALVEGFTKGLPGVSSYKIISVHNFGLFDFKYPHGLTFNRLPFIGEPQWKQREFFAGDVSLRAPTLCYGVHDGIVVPLPKDDPALVLKEASEIICACSPDPRGAHAFQTLLEQTLGVTAASQSHRMLPLISMSERGIEDAFNAGHTTQGEGFQGLLRRAEAKRFFDYNFNTNSFMVFGKALRAVGVENPTLMSKWMLQVLFWFEVDRRHGPFSEGAVFKHMCDWSGWVPHAPKPFPGVVGSPTSQAVMLENLLSMELLRRAGHRDLEISDRGTAFILQIHPDCQDMDLPWRLPKWEDNWPESRPNVERYLRTFFGRQSRYRSPK